ncbi:MAG: hypothetical protein LBI18_15300 [Planctomycetaceae bacterium]|jgi:hypothetical protein|nr:hypothetical protein [Planctomycetaceae bacterium]
MKTHCITLLSLVFSVVSVVSAQAEYLSESFTFGKVPGGQSASVELDFSSYDLSTANSFVFEFPLGLTSSFYFTNDDYGGDFSVPANTVYAGTVSYTLSVTADKGNGPIPLDVTNVNEFDVAYTVTEAINLSEGDPAYRTLGTQSDLYPGLTLTASEFIDLLDADQHLNLDFAFTGPTGSLDSFLYQVGIASGIRVESLEGMITVSFDSAPVTPEPASWLIFGTAVILGIPIVRRFRRK